LFHEYIVYGHRFRRHAGLCPDAKPITVTNAYTNAFAYANANANAVAYTVAVANADNNTRNT
jgi:hypothetical protein